MSFIKSLVKELKLFSLSPFERELGSGSLQVGFCNP